MIPPEKSDSVKRGLREAFGATGFEGITELTIGPTADLIFRIVVCGSPYLLRIVRRVSDPACHFICMKGAARAGLAPRVWYTSVEDRLAITDFASVSPFPLTQALVRIPAALRSLHALAPFPARANQFNTTCTFLLNRGPAADGFIQSFHAANILPEAERAEVFARYAQMEAAYNHHGPDPVSSHNDLKPENILFDGNRVWLVDWEAAFLNDRYVDLAVIANFVTANEPEERIFLQEYFGQPPDDYQMARFFLMRQVFHLFYAMAFLLSGAAGGKVNLTEPAPEFLDFHRRIWAAEVNLRDNRMRLAYGRVHWEQLLRNIRMARFEDALSTVLRGVVC